MTAAAQQNQQPRSLLSPTNLDADEAVLPDDPPMKALHPKLKLSPSPPPDIPSAQLIRCSGAAILVACLDNGPHSDTSPPTHLRSVPADDAEQIEGCSARSPSPPTSPPGRRDRHATSRHHAPLTTPNLRHLAADALQVVVSEPASVPAPRGTPDISTSTRQLSLRDDRSTIAAFSSTSSRVLPRSSVRLNTDSHLIDAGLSPDGGELPPLQMDSTKSESGGQILPSIRSTLGDLNHLPSEPPTPADPEMPALHCARSAFARSPPAIRPRLPPVASAHISPPISPNDAFQRGLPSPHSLPASSPYSFYPTSTAHHRHGVEYGCNLTGETSNSELALPNSTAATSVAERMSIDGITNPQAGVYVCNFSGCTAPPFQTQYLLNSHANVHSSARPHYCPVQGCPRSEGGKGFKRKNEMIRHGLVHDSPGYVCPFCPDREHKYPRPDNLQRHVRVHHVDKDKDDPMLREVLSQRPDGPNRGRRRRGGPA